MKIENMTRVDALTALKDGYRVTHHLFTSDEFIYMVDGFIYDESGYDMGTVNDEFMNIYHTGGNWEGGWSIYF